MMSVRLEGRARVALLLLMGAIPKEEVLVSGLRASASQLRDLLAAADPELSAGVVCAEIAEELAATEKACAAARVRFAARAAHCGEHRKRGFIDAPSWIAQTIGSSIGEARAELATVEAMTECPATQEAVNAGELSLTQAAEIARVPRCEAELLEVARHASLRTLKERAKRRHLEGIRPEDLYAEQFRQREVRHWRDDLDMRRGTFAFASDFGARFAKRLDAETDRVWRTAWREGRSVTRSQCAADAFQNLFEPKAKAARRPAEPELVFVVDVNAYARGHAHPGEPCHIIDGGPIPVWRVRELAVGAFVKALLHDGTKVDSIVHYGRRRPALLQSVLDLGDPPDFEGAVCSEEGCGRRMGLEWDHVDPVAHGGLTTRGNLKPSCKPHHLDKTERDRRTGLLERGPP
jgi:hypothetical protein